MRNYLLAALTDEERAFAATLLEDAGESLEHAVAQLFENTNDPLLSASDVAELLGPNADAARVKEALEKAAADGVLETSTSTQRPFDSPETELYRRAHYAP